MGSPYVLIVSLLLYVLIVRTSSVRTIHPIVATVLVVIPPFILAKVMWYIYLVGYDLPLFQLITWSDGVTLLTQLIAAFGIFYKLEKNDDDISSWFAWSTAGFLVIFFLVPYVVRLVVPA